MQQPVISQADIERQLGRMVIERLLLEMEIGRLQARVATLTAEADSRASAATSSLATIAAVAPALGPSLVTGTVPGVPADPARVEAIP